ILPVKPEICQEIPSASFFPKEGSHVRFVPLVLAGRSCPASHNGRSARTGHPHRPATPFLSPGRVGRPRPGGGRGTARGRRGDGYRVEARIVIWESDNVLKVPAGALFCQSKEQAVYVRLDGKAVSRRVKVGHNNGLEAEVLDGLKEGDEVVVHPGDK